MVTRFAASLRTDISPQPKEAQPLSQLDIRLIQHFDSSALWSDGPEVALNWLFPYPIQPPHRDNSRGASAPVGPVLMPHHGGKIESKSWTGFFNPKPSCFWNQKPEAAKPDPPPPPLLITSRFVNGNMVRNFPTHGQLSAAQGSPNCLSTLTLPFNMF
jgi:hypothetical protein